MSWGQGASEGASTGANIGSTAGTAMDTGSTAASTPGGWDMGTANDISAANQSMDITGSVNSPSEMGPAESSWLEKAYSTYDRFNKGADQSLPEAWKNRGMNPETFGYGYGKLNQFASLGKGGQTPQAPATINNYQHPENPYLRKRGY